MDNNLQAWLEDYFPEDFSFRDRLAELETLLQGGAIVTEREIAFAIRFRYRKALLLLLRYFDLTALSDTKKTALWLVSIGRGDIDYLQFLQDICGLTPPRKFYNKADIALSALYHGSVPVYFWLKENFSIENVISDDTAIDVSLEFGSTALTWGILTSQGATEEAICKQIAAWIEMHCDGTAELFIDALDRLFLSSELRHIKLISEMLEKKYPAFSSALKDAEAARVLWGAMVCRYTSLAIHAYQVQLYRLSLSDYLIQQRDFGKKAHDLVCDQYNRVSNNLETSVREIFKVFSAWNSSMAERRGHHKRAKECQLFRDEFPDMERETPIGNAAGDSPYALLLPLVESTCKAAQGGRWGAELTFHTSPTGYTVNYLPKGSEIPIAFPLTHVVLHPEIKEWMWRHNSDPLVPWRYLEEIHKKIIYYSGSIDQLHRLIAEGFWLGSHIMITWRGNGLYMRMLMALWYKLHGLAAPIPSLLYPSPDAVALSLPLSHFCEPAFFQGTGN